MLFPLAGFFLMPALSAACSMEPGSDASCCQITASAHTSSAVASHVGDQRDEKAAHPCDNRGSHSACQCSTVNVAVALPLIEMETGQFSGLPENLSLYIESGIASGFHSTWLPPKIG